MLLVGGRLATLILYVYVMLSILPFSDARTTTRRADDINADGVDVKSCVELKGCGKRPVL